MKKLIEIIAAIATILVSGIALYKFNVDESSSGNYVLDKLENNTVWAYNWKNKTCEDFAAAISSRKTMLKNFDEDRRNQLLEIVETGSVQKLSAFMKCGVRILDIRTEKGQAFLLSDCKFTTQLPKQLIFASSLKACDEIAMRL